MLRQVARPLRHAIRRRNMSSAHEEHVQEVKNWYKYTLGMLGLSTIFSVVNIGIIMNSDEHPLTPDSLPYMKVRSKEFPWSCSDCAFFDYHCWDECKAAKAAESE